MNISEINKQNLNQSVWLNPDVAENIGRTDYTGIAVDEAGQIQAVLVWKVKRSEMAAYFLQFTASDVEAAQTALAACEQRLQAAHIKSMIFQAPQINEISRQALEKSGFRMGKTQPMVVQTTIEELLALSVMKLPAKRTQLVNLGSLSILQLRTAVRGCLLGKKQGSLEDIGTLPVHWYEPDVSCCLMQENGMVYGMFLVHRLTSGGLTVELMYANKPAEKKDLVCMMQAAARAAASKYKKDTTILLKKHTELAKTMIDRLFPDSDKLTWIMAQKLIPETIAHE